MAQEGTAPTSGTKKKRPYRNCANYYLWLATLLVILMHAIYGVVVLILLETGDLVDSRSFGCLNSQTDFVAQRLKQESGMLYCWVVVNLLVCILLLLWIWIRRVRWSIAVFAISSLIVLMGMTLLIFQAEESKEIKRFEEQHTNLTLQSSNHNESDCRINDVLRWQVEYKCCGAQSYEEWGSSFPDSCLCEGNITGCVPDGGSFVYETPCLPTVVSLLKKRTFTFWIVMMVWVSLISLPLALVVMTFCLFYTTYFFGEIVEEWSIRLSNWWYIKRGGEEMIPVVFLNNNNNQPKEENEKGEEEKESDVQVSVKVPVMWIPLSALQKMQEELDLPPVQHQVYCLCLDRCKGRTFYTVMLEEESPYLPTGVKLADPNKRPSSCFWADGGHIFSLKYIIWPR